MSNLSSGMRPSNKRIIICCDGTWQNSHGEKRKVPTNVTRITRALKSYTDGGIAQVVYYQSGVGTGGLVNRIVGGGTGYGLSEHVREAYGFLAHNYHPGDDTHPADTIHLLGFSRGAYTARSICGLICRFGLLTKKGMDSFHEIYDYYKDGTDRKDPGLVSKLRARQDGKFVIPNVEIETICCWDTVGSLGIPSLGLPIIGNWISGIEHRKYSFHDTGLLPGVKHAFHALALDERRRHFQPTLWKKTEETKDADLKQCWFPGVHSNIGGGFDDQEIADMTLAWMMQQLLPFLEFDDNYLDNIIRNCDMHSEGQWATGKIYDDTWTQWLLNWGGKTRKLGVDDSTEETWIMWLLGWGGKTETEKLGVDDSTKETIHKSVRVRNEFDPEWSKGALRGWTWSEDGYWTKGSKRIGQDELGSLEKKLAGKAVVRDQIKKDL